MARISEGILPDGVTLGLTIDRYQEIMQIPIASFNGLLKPDDVKVYECNSIWTQSNRDMLAMFLMSAEEIREQELGFHMAPKYIEDEDYEFDNPLALDRKHLITVGEYASTDIELGVTITHRDGANAIIDPIIITVTTDVTVTDEICVFYPGEDVPITPSRVTLAGGEATIRIPRSRLVKPELNDDREDPLQYDDDVNFLTTVDVKRCYTDTSVGVTFVWKGDQVQCQPNCTEETQSGCATIDGYRGNRLSTISVYPTTAEGVATHYTHCPLPRYVRVSYLSGLRNNMKKDLETARLSHTLMPNKICPCSAPHQYWTEDNTDAEFQTPYGNKRGAVMAWMTDSRMKVGQGGKFPKMRYR